MGGSISAFDPFGGIFDSIGDIFGGILDPIKDIFGVFLGPMKDLLLIAGFSSGIFLFFTTYHRKAIYQAGRSAISTGAQMAPMMLV